MAAVATVGVLCSGHDCHPPRASAASTNPTVYAGGVPIHIVGDSWPVHSCEEDFHVGFVISGSSRTFINGKPIARIGDGIGGECFSLIAAGNPSVFCGG